MPEKLCEICNGDGEVEYEIAVVDYEHGGYLKSAVPLILITQEVTLNQIELS